MNRIRVGDVQLHVNISGSGPAVLLLHGFTGTCAMWLPFRRAWARFTTIAVDLLGHGASDAPADRERYAIDRIAADLVKLMRVLGRPDFAVVGYSMGGRVALHLALQLAREAPRRPWALVLESTSAGIDDAAARRARARTDAELAAMIERDGVPAFVAHWETLPLLASQRRLRPSVRAAVRSQRLAHSAMGLAGILRGAGVGAHDSLAGRLHALGQPVLLVAGALDTGYCTRAREMAAVLPRPRVAVIQDAGHAVHLEQRERFAALVADFLGTCVHRPSALTAPARPQEDRQWR